MLCSFGFSMFSRVEKAVSLASLMGSKSPDVRYKIPKLFLLFSFNYKLFKFASVSQM